MVAWKGHSDLIFIVYAFSIVLLLITLAFSQWLRKAKWHGTSHATHVKNPMISHEGEKGQDCDYVGLNSVRREILSSVTIVYYDKVRGRNKAQR